VLDQAHRDRTLPGDDPERTREGYSWHMIEDAIQRWAGRPVVRSHHRRVADADPQALWDAASSVRLDDTRALGKLVRWRIPGTPGDITYHELFQRYPFTPLEEGDTYLISGLVGRIWTLQRDYPRLAGAEDYEAWDEHDTVRVLIAHWTRPAEGGGSELVSDARVEPIGRRAALRIRSLWAVVGTFERLIGAEPLVIAQRRAESAVRS
jgi:hypothetical protein